MTSSQLVAACFAVLLMFGCAAKTSRPSTEVRAETAAGVRDVIVYDAVGGSIDSATAIGDAITLPDAVREALRTHGGVQAALARVRVAQAEAHQARLLPNPVVSVVFRFPESGAQPTIEASLAAELLSLLRKPSEAKAADYRLQAASAEAIEVVIDTIAEVESQYVATQALDAMTPVLEERSALLNRLRDAAQKRFDAGEGTRLDVTVLQTQRAELEVDIAQQELERREARFALAKLIGRPSSEAAWKLDAFAAEWSPVAGERAWVAAALEHHPSIEARTWELAALGVDVKIARWALFEGTEVGVDAEREEGEWSVGPGLSAPLPIFDWGQARRAAADARRVEALHKLTQAKRDVIEGVRRAHASFTASAAVQRRVRDELLPLLERRRTDTEAAYRAGEADVVFLLLTERELQESRTKLIDLQRRSGEALVRLRHAVGGAGFVPPEASVSTTQHTNE